MPLRHYCDYCGNETDVTTSVDVANLDRECGSCGQDICVSCIRGDEMCWGCYEDTAPEDRGDDGFTEDF